MYASDFPSRGACDREQHCPGDHLHSGREGRLLWQRRMACPDRPGGPGERPEQHDGRAQDVDGTAADEQAHACESREHTQEGARREAGPEANPVEQRDPERRRRDDQRSHTGAHTLLGPRDPAVADE